jgi:hypothetical protein
MAIIFASKPGQLGNRLILYAHLLSFSKEYNVLFFNPAFDEYKVYFKNIKSYGRIVDRLLYILSFYFGRLLDKLKISNSFIACRYIDFHEHINLEKSISTSFLFSKICFLQGWKYRTKNLLQKYRPEILEKFTPDTVYLEEINNFCQLNFKAEHLVIGMHVRRGDYIRFESGKYYFELEDYHLFMKKIVKCFPDKKLMFMIASNDKDAKTYFSNTDLDLVMAPDHELSDMYCLSRCNYICGPPSTYTIWASYYGEVPLQIIYSKDHSFSPEGFEIYRDI